MYQILQNLCCCGRRRICEAIFAPIAHRVFDFRSPYDRTHLTLPLDSVAYEEKIMRPHENMSARNTQVHSNDVFSTNETPFLIFGPFFQKLAASVQ